MNDTLASNLSTFDVSLVPFLNYVEVSLLKAIALIIVVSETKCIYSKARL